VSLAQARSGHFVLLSSRSDGRSDQLEVPTQPVFLVGSPRRRWRLDPRAPRQARGAVVLEEVRQGGRPVLLMLCGQAGQARRNGRLAAPVEVLQVGDEIRCRGREFFVSRYHGRRVAMAMDQRVGKPCPLCRTEVESGQQVYSCTCGAALHCVDDPGVPAEDRLECARLTSTCPHCGQDIDFSEGLAWEPGR
jgi:hypothetical protein